MPTVKVRGGKKLTLGPDELKASGGEGDIFIVGDTVYKVCHPGKMIPEAKFKELNVLDHKRIVRPIAILEDDKKHPVGYTMSRVPGNAVPLAQILSKTYREREGVTPDMMKDLVSQIAEAVRFVHSKPGYLQVDGNEWNYMITADHKDAYLIDVNSFETPSFPADAIMASVRDWSVKVDPTGRHLWSHMSDWYSFAVISFYMFTAFHPFKHRHPRFPNIKTAMQDQMQAGVSVFDREAAFPQAACYFPFENVVPGGKDGLWMQWFKAVLGENKRLPAPDGFQAVIKFVTQVQNVIGSNNFDIAELRDFASQIVGYYESSGSEAVVTADAVYINNQRYPRPQGKFRIGFSPVNRIPVALCWENGVARVYRFDMQTEMNHNIACDDIMSYNGRLYYKSGPSIMEMRFIENAIALTVGMGHVANVMPQATQMYQGVVFQDVFGTRVASFFPEAGHHRQITIKELAGKVITDAKFESNVLMVLANDKEGQATRYVFRFAADYGSYDMRAVENVAATGLNFTVIDKGICICLTEDERIEIFSNGKGSPHLKVISDPAIKGNMRLCHSGPQTRFALGPKLHSIAVKK